MQKQKIEICEDVVNYGVWLNSKDYFEDNCKRLFLWWLYATAVLIVQVVVTVDVAFELGIGPVENKQELVWKRKITRYLIGFIISVILVKGLLNKCKVLLYVVQSEANKGMKALFILMLWIQMIQTFVVYAIVFKIVARSETNIDILSNAFGIVILNEFDDYGAIFYRMYLEPFENELTNDEDFMKLHISKSGNITSFGVICFVWFCSFFTSDVIVHGSLDILLFNGFADFKSVVVFIQQLWYLLLPFSLTLLNFLIGRSSIVAPDNQQVEIGHQEFKDDQDNSMLELKNEKHEDLSKSMYSLSKINTLEAQETTINSKSHKINSNKNRKPLVQHSTNIGQQNQNTLKQTPEDPFDYNNNPNSSSTIGQQPPLDAETNNQQFQQQQELREMLKLE